jgi:hypothetical protein
MSLPNSEVVNLDDVIQVEKFVPDLIVVQAPRETFQPKKFPK